MATTVFVSPGVYTREQDFTFFASRIGITKLGAIGLTLKGPAFEPIKCSTTDEFFARFGGTSVDLQLPYVAQSFLKQSSELTITRVLGKSGFTNAPAWLILASGGTMDKTVLAVIRGKLSDDLSTYNYSSADTLKMFTSTSAATGSIILSSTTGPLTAFTNSGLTISLDESSNDYVVKSLGKNPKRTAGDYGIYVEAIYPHMVREAVNSGEITKIYGDLTYQPGSYITNYNASYTNSSTPWIVGKVAGGATRNLFKIETISDGDSSAKELKFSFANIDEVNGTFDLIVRNFYDTDSNTATSGRLEMFRQLTMDDSLENFIGRKIGTTDEIYPRKSSYITITLADNFPRNQVPAGFRGYSMNYSAGTWNAPKFYYKTSYLSADTVSKTYLGISELGYTGFTSDRVAYSKTIQSVEMDMFAFQGADSSSRTTIKGFHMENTAPTSDFEVGQYNSLTGYTKAQRKFTVAPAGGFDGWNKYKDVTFADNVDLYNIQAFKDAIDTQRSTDSIDINLLATPGVNFYDNENIIKYALEMAEERADCLYIIDSPRVSTDSVKGTATEIVELLDAVTIDSNYAATYWPWIQIEDAATSKYVFIPPTSEVVRCFALTDNISYPWFATGGINRGKFGSNVVKVDVKLSRDDRDVLYAGRINPINYTLADGVHILGQKNLQIKPSVLDRINVRRLLLHVRRLVSAAALTVLFEQNDQTIRDQFVAKVQPLLLQIQNQRGIAGFRIVMDDFNPNATVVDENTLIGKIQIKPTPTAEFIDLTFQVLPTGARFEDF